MKTLIVSFKILKLVAILNIMIFVRGLPNLNSWEKN